MIAKNDLVHRGMLVTGKPVLHSAVRKAGSSVCEYETSVLQIYQPVKQITNDA